MRDTLRLETRWQEKRFRQVVKLVSLEPKRSSLECVHGWKTRIQYLLLMVIPIEKGLLQEPKEQTDLLHLQGRNLRQAFDNGFSITTLV